jgi:hypothetical protein
MPEQIADKLRKLLVHSILYGLIILAFGIWLWPKNSGGEEKTYPELVNQAASLYPDISVLETVEQIAFSSDWREETHRTIPQGGHAMVILRMGVDRTCEPLNISVLNAQVLVFLPTKIINSSSRNSPVGTYYDILAPVNLVTCKLSPYRLVEWRPDKDGMVYVSSGNKVVSVKVKIDGQFKGASKPFFVGLSNSFLVKGHCRFYCSREAELGQKYSAILRHHHVTPIQTWISAPPIRDGFLDLNYGQSREQSFWQTGGGSEQRYVNFPRLNLYEDKKAYLRALERTIHVEGLAGRAWVYVKDEPSDISALIKELALYRSHAPSVLTMVTTPYRDDLANLIDVFSPNIAQWDKSEKGYDEKSVWPYASCMGSCGPNRAFKEDINPVPGPEVNRADFLIDRPASRLYDYFIKLAQARADGGLYYHAVEGHALYRKGIDVIKDPWNFGGNGDGVLIYPGRPGELGLKKHMALPSFRLKLIRQAMELYW